MKKILTTYSSVVSISSYKCNHSTSFQSIKSRSEWISKIFSRNRIFIDRVTGIIFQFLFGKLPRKRAFRNELAGNGERSGRRKGKIVTPLWAGKLYSPHLYRYINIITFPCRKVGTGQLCGNIGSFRILGLYVFKISFVLAFRPTLY